MRKRNYLKVSYKRDGIPCSQDFTMKEVTLINAVLKELSDDGKVSVELKECSQEEYTQIFG